MVTEIPATREAVEPMVDALAARLAGQLDEVWARATITPSYDREWLARAAVVARANGRCELCWAPSSLWPLEWAHRIARSRGGRWRPSNGVMLCSLCHQWTGEHSWWAVLGGWRLVHANPGTDPARVPAWLRTHTAPDGAWHVLDDDGLTYWLDDTELTPQLPTWLPQPRAATDPHSEDPMTVTATDPNDMTQEEFLNRLIDRFGPDPMAWAFRCPHCDDVATGADFRAALAENPLRRKDGTPVITSDVLGQVCIGRVLGTLDVPAGQWTGRGCDWTANGLFCGPLRIIRGSDGAVLYAFPLA